MGCDGGSIPKRSEVVKNKSKEETRDKQAELAAKWHFCHLSGFPLAKPIVACQLGHLYNKDRLIEYLLELKMNGVELKPELAHIKSLKDVKEITLKDKTDSESGTHQVSGRNEKFRAQYVCPISGLDMNGKYKFYYSLQCGCVVSEKAIREVTDDGVCIVCSRPYDTEMDLIVINGDSEDVDKLTEKLDKRKELQKIERQKEKRLQKQIVKGLTKAKHSLKRSTDEIEDEEKKMTKKNRKIEDDIKPEPDNSRSTAAEVR